MRSDCRLDRRNWIGLNWLLQPRLASLSAAFPKVLGYTCLHKLLDLPVSLVRVNLGSVCNLNSLISEYFRECSVHVVLYLRTWVYYFCGLRKLFSEFAFKATFRSLGVWSHLAPAFFSPKDMLCSIALFLFIFWPIMNSSGERELLECGKFSAFRAKWLSQKEAKTVSTNSSDSYIAIDPPVWKDFI